MHKNERISTDTESKGAQTLLPICTDIQLVCIHIKEAAQTKQQDYGKSYKGGIHTETIIEHEREAPQTLKNDCGDIKEATSYPKNTSYIVQDFSRHGTWIAWFINKHSDRLDHPYWIVGTLTKCHISFLFVFFFSFLFLCLSHQ